MTVINVIFLQLARVIRRMMCCILESTNQLSLQSNKSQWSKLSATQKIPDPVFEELITDKILFKFESFRNGKN